MEYVSGSEAGSAPEHVLRLNMGQSKFEMCVPDFVSQIEK